ncbi:MAG TPA: AAA family ATPase, partial [Anaerolineae bacterium]|nr:AAA family ATPase [Anaerolineae bacterium]
MHDTLLATKLYVPPPRAGAVARPRLIEKLRAGLDRPHTVTLLSGPAGSGKTTLLSEFVATTGHPVAWLSLDAADDDPARFWAYLIAACQSAIAGLGEAALSLVHAPQPLPPDAVPTILINDLAAQDKVLVLILDDLHELQSHSIHAGLTFLLDHLPGSLRLVV